MTEQISEGLSETTLSELRELAARYPQARSALLPMLHIVQSAQGRVTAEGIEVCGRILGLTEAEVSAVATFYTMYKRRPMGTHHVGVCTNTLCAVMGGDEIFERLCGHLDVGNDETTEDGRITLERVECNAACDFAPVMMVNWEFFDNQTPESAMDVVDKLRSGETVQSPRGATITSWREAERVIGGFEDGLVDEGPAAGPASLVGLEIADQRGWAAPPLDASGTEAAPESTTEAVAEADTSRAESETVAEQTDTDVEGGADLQESEGTDD
ncbi:NADH-quinone oxidoreductase subunit NuoE [Aeromicrobium choanae]|uniref:NADH dehydrogenase subunit E n=1 Tax=Aeromicrobium choanae TaxID=1736691 RepID=A0A1T4YVB4_9ACTN|nr:NADH-quinone oxidoreductase subunit NuoE [Aeromicrobium choanae]SKB05710.1 NADH dehydrogenase subunit E [Aeromicrobium choanae]